MLVNSSAELGFEKAGPQQKGSAVATDLEVSEKAVNSEGI